VSRACKLAVLGGSGAFTPELAFALTTWQHERPPAAARLARPRRRQAHASGRGVPEGAGAD